MNVAYSYLWRLHAASVEAARGIVEELRQYAVKMGAESVGDLIELTGNDAHIVRTGASIVMMFDAVLPTVRSATLSAVGIEQYGLASSDGTSWEWSGIVRVSGFQEISKLIHAAAEFGIETQQTFCGIVRSAKRSSTGEVIYDQRYALQIDLENF
jgi:hypothetical protein